MWWFLTQIVVGYIYGHIAEYFLHRFLHARGKKKKSLFGFHFHDHHKTARLNGFRDDNYADTIFQWNEIGKEVFYLTLTVLSHLPVVIVAPWFFATLVVSAIEYYWVHRKSHLNPAWAEVHLHWHWAHHMKNQNKSWGVRSNLIDRILGTDQ
jgi:hypothetical protein